MVNFNRTPNPSGSPIEKLVTQGTVEPIDFMVGTFLSDTPTREEVIEVLTKYYNWAQESLDRQNRLLEKWANTHTHPNAGGGFPVNSIPDQFNSTVIGSAIKGSGQSSFNGAIWGIISGGVLSRLNVGPGGTVTQVNGGTIVNSASFTTARAAFATTATQLYLLSTNDGSPEFLLISGVDSVSVKALPSTVGLLNEGDTCIVGLGDLVYGFGRVAAGSPAAAVYNPVSNSWTALTPPVDGLRECKAFSYNGKVYVSPGLSGGVPTVGYMRRYDPALDTWENLSPFPSAITSPAAVSFQVVNDLVYVFGGVSAGVPLHFYSPELDQWVRSEATGTGPGNGSAARGLVTGYLSSKIYLAGNSSTTVRIYG